MRTRFSQLVQQLLLATTLLGGAVLGSTTAFAGEDVFEPVNINTDSAATLAAGLNGIGLRRAEQIVEYREANGSFKDAYELTVIKGIGERIVARNESRIRLSE
ncbi:MAG: ComEA family DNA-binding protein [Pseudomonadales bacterium]